MNAKQKKYTLTAVIFAVILFFAQVVITFIIEQHLRKHCSPQTKNSTKVEQAIEVEERESDSNEDTWDPERRPTLTIYK